jgi:hypothetical protein
MDNLFLKRVSSCIRVRKKALSIPLEKMVFRRKTPQNIL